MKKAYNYQLVLKGLTNPKGEALNMAPLEFEFQNHDDLFRILELSTKKPLFENPSDNVEFFIGLKLFSEVLLRHRKSPHPMTEDLSLAVGSFMKKIKSK